MLKRYSNFVRPLSHLESRKTEVPLLTGEEAKRLYLEEIEVAGQPIHSRQTRSKSRKQHIDKGRSLEDISNRDLYKCVQNNDVQTLNYILDSCPNMINITDEFGWSLLMIACQANSVEAAKELLKRGIDTCVRDRAGNSAQSLVIKNRNFVLADILSSKKPSESAPVKKKTEDKVMKTKSKVRYACEICNKEFSDKQEHLSSTVHNISASKDKKVPASYVIPASNKGYQIMLKVGWDKESGLGPDGSGKKYPIKTVQKQDRKGLGLDKRKKKLQDERKEIVKHVNKKMFNRESINSRNMEINFRRQFY